VIHALISDEQMGLGVRIAIVNMPADGEPGPAEVMHLVPFGDTITDRWDQVQNGAVIEPTLILPESAARALLTSLGRHFDGAEDMRALRRDYDAERQRVDRLTGALIQLAAGLLADPAPHVETVAQNHLAGLIRDLPGRDT
jgi:hypothetical protein